MVVKINNKSDFKINEWSESIALEVPFEFSYYIPLNKEKYVASFDGHKYINCTRLEDGSLDVIFNSHGLGIGRLKVVRKYYVDDSSFADGVFDVTSDDLTDVFLTSGKTFDTYVRTLVVPPYLKGDKGDPMTWNSMTDKERGELVEEIAEAIDPEMVMTENEKSRQEAEQSRQTAEQQRSATFNTLKGDMQSAITAGNTAAGNAQKVVDEYETKVAEQDSKLSELGSEVKSTVFCEVGAISVVNGTNINDQSFVRTPFLLIPSTKIIHVCAYDGGVSNDYCLVYYYNNEKQFIRADKYNEGTAAFIERKISSTEIPSNAVYFRAMATPSAVNKGIVFVYGLMPIFSEALDNLTNKTKDNENNILTLDNKFTVNAERYIADIDGYYFTANGYFEGSGKSSSEFIDVAEGDIIELTGVSPYGERTIWGTETKNFNNPTTFIRAEDGNTFNRYVIKIPKGVNYIIFNGNTGIYIDIYRSTIKPIEVIESKITEVFDVNISIQEFIIRPATGKLTILSGTGYSGMIPVTSGERYMYSGQASAYNLGVAGFDENMTFVAKIIYNGTDAVIRKEFCDNEIFEIPAGVSYIACSTRYQNTYPLGLKKIIECKDFNEDKLYKEIAYDKINGYGLNTLNGNTFVNANSEVTDFIRVRGGDIIKVSSKFGGQNGICSYDDNHQYISYLADNSVRTGIHYVLNECIDFLIRIPSGISYIRVASNSYKTNPVAVKIKNGDCKDKFKYVWFGDSISQLGELPHTVCNKIGVEVADVSFAGAPLTYSSEKYQNTGFMGIVDCIINGDYTPVEEALSLQEKDGTDITDKTINLNNLKAIDWNDVTHIVVLAGTNDLSYSAATIDNIKQGLSSAITKLVSKYPHVTLYFISPPYRAISYNDVNGLDLKDINGAIKDVCESFNYPFFDFFHNCGVNQANKGYYLDSQGLHPNLEGEIVWSNKISNWLKSL